MSGDRHSLDALFRARSVAIIGASTDANKIGGRPVKFLRNSGFSGGVYPINPKAEIIQDFRAYADIRTVPDPIDHALIAVPAAGVIAAVEGCAEKGVRAVTIFSGGFAELDEAGAEAQRRIAEIARAADMRILGPNCVGMINLHSGLMASFMLDIDNGLPPLGRLALISQSGAVGGEAFFSARERGLPLGACVTTGNECDVDIAECISYFAGDDETEIIMCYLEGCRRPDAFIAALAEAQRRNKRVIILKAGRSEIGAAAAQSHTGKLAGNYRVYQSLFERYGVIEARSMEDFFDIALVAMAGQPVTGRKLGLFTVSGGVGALMADAVSESALELPPLPETAQHKLRAIIPIASVPNPVDGTAQVWADWEKFYAFLELMIAEGEFDCAILFFSALPYSPPVGRLLLEMLTRLRKRFPDQMIVASLRGTDELQSSLRELGYLVFEDPVRAISAFGALARRKDFSASAAPVDIPDTAQPIVLPSQPDEHQSKALLARAGLPVPEEKIVRTITEAKEAADALGYPVVLKLLSPEIIHKSEIGGVILDIGDRARLEHEFRIMADRLANLRRPSKRDGMIVAPMIAGGMEMILGVQTDPVFGAVVLVGFGGIFVEILNDVALRLAPVGKAEARRMVESLKGFALLDGARGRPKFDVDALADAVSRLSVFAYANAKTIAAIDVNPFIVLSDGQGGAVLDASIIPAATAS